MIRLIQNDPKTVGILHFKTCEEFVKNKLFSK